MNDTLHGVIVGGLIGGFIPVVTLIVENRKWRIELQLTHLRALRDELEQLFRKSSEAILAGMATNSYDISMLSDIDFRVPDEVRNVFNTFMEEKEGTPEKMRQHYYSLQRSMKSELVRLDCEIDLVVAGRSWMDCFFGGRRIHSR